MMGAMSWWLDIIVVLACYAIGSLSFGAVVARKRGVDIFSTGSGSAGATNVRRTVGGVAGYLVFALDFAKGLVPSLAMAYYLPKQGSHGLSIAMAGMVAILLGHSYSIFCKFRGGKGIATMMGGLAVFMPRTLLMGAIVWLVIFHATRIVSVASLCFTASVLLTSYLFSYPGECIVFALVLNLLAFWRHRENLHRLLQGTEHRFTDKN
jgi:glycerol-3-phosphate acyltransferase PlsY